MFGSQTFKKVTALSQLAGMLVAAVFVIAPNTASAQGFGDMLYSPNQGQSAQSSRTLRNPMIPTASTANAYQAPYQGQAPAIGSGMTPAPLIQGDLGGPSMVPSGLANQDHGNIFGTRSGQMAKGPNGYVNGAGRIPTQNGQQQGMYEYGQGQYNGTGYGPGGKNYGTAWQNNGGAAYDSSGMGPGGKNGGNSIMNFGGPASDATSMGSGGQSAGTGWVNNGGAATNSTGMGPGGKNGGTGYANNGGAASDATRMGAGGKNTGIGIVNNGGAGSGATGMGPGGKNGGSGIQNNGGPASDAEASGDKMYTHDMQSNRYDFNGPLPTVRTFSRYLVILGVVAATVFMGMAAWSVVMGNQYGGARVIGAASGLLFLLAGYTIWKVVQMNTFHANSTGVEAHYRDGTPMSLNGPDGKPYNTGVFSGPMNPGNNNTSTGTGNGGNNGNPNGGASNPNGGASNPNGGNTVGTGGNTGGNIGGNTGGNTGGNNGGFIPILGN